jgi:hypothetical protein
VSDLYPTKTRLALLRDVADGEVWQHSNGESVVSLSGDTGGPSVARCTAAIEEQRDAGWVHLVELKHGAKQWQRTDAGRAVLDGAS